MSAACELLSIRAVIAYAAIAVAFASMTLSILTIRNCLLASFASLDSSLARVRTLNAAAETALDAHESRSRRAEPVA